MFISSPVSIADGDTMVRSALAREDLAPWLRGHVAMIADLARARGYFRPHEAAMIRGLAMGLPEHVTARQPAPPPGSRTCELTHISDLVGRVLTNAYAAASARGQMGISVP